MGLTKVTNDLLDLGSDTGALGLPKGTEAQRPSNPVEGTLRHNSEIDETKLETYNGTEWRKINKVIPAYAVDYLVVAGGGSAGDQYSGGGGAGGLRTSYGSISGGGSTAEPSLQLIPSTLYAITVGAGGSSVSGVTALGNQGSNSSFDSIISIGGGSSYLSSPSTQGANGGSGGASRYVNAPLSSGTFGQGFGGGRGSDGLSAYTNGGGGGGAGQIGQNANSTTRVGGYGGNGVEVNIKGGTGNFYAGGGGGSGPDSGQDGGLGGSGGGGNGGKNGLNPLNGSTNTGGGSGGGANTIGASGGSGVVILRMPTSRYSGTTTGSPTVTTDGTDTILTYTSSGTYTA